MRFAVVSLLVAACGSGGLPPRPDKAAFDKLTDDQKCEATVPVGARCAAEVADADLRTSFVGLDAPSIGPVTDKEAENVYLSYCRGVVGDSNARAAYACWDKAIDCAAFAACVTAPASSR